MFLHFWGILVIQRSMIYKRFSFKLVFLISLAFLIPVVTSLLVLKFSSEATIQRLSTAINQDYGKEQYLLKQIFPDEKINLNPRETLVLLKQYEKRRSFGLFTSFLVISILLAAVVLIMSIIILKRAMLTLRDLSNAAKDIGEGNFTAKVKSHSHDEFSNLAEAFSLMTNKLKETTVSKNFYNHILEVVPAAIFTVNNINKIVTWNKQAEIITGYKANEVLEKPADKLKMLPFMLEGIPGRREVSIQTKENKTKIISCDIEGFSDRRGVGMIGTFIDVTEERKLSKQLVIAKERAEDASRVRTEFLANMSHEIRTPLNGIIGMTDILHEEENDDEKRGMLSTIAQCGKRLLHLINEILELSKLEAGKEKFRPEETDLNHIVDSSFAAIDAQCRKKQLDVIKEISKDLSSRITTDTGKLTRILINLLSNGVKFTDTGFIKLTANKYLGEKPGNIIFSVEDTGRGIPKERQKFIFESFVQADEYLTREDSSGLGLAISKKLIEMLDGEIWVESEKGKGSKFFFTVTLGGI